MSRLRDGFCPGTLICYLTAGFPNLDKSVELALACVRGGADVIEIGVPFTDPVADGPVIQMTSRLALERGMTPSRAFDVVARGRAETDVPIVLMGYYNPTFRIGEQEYAERAVRAGADGLIVPDLPMEESSGLERACRANDIDLIQLVGKTTSPQRMAAIARHSSGFLYLVSGMGTTGGNREMGASVRELVERARLAAGDLPVGIGFGVVSHEQVRTLHDYGADGVIVGSALLQRIAGGASAREVEEFVASLR